MIHVSFVKNIAFKFAVIQVFNNNQFCILLTMNMPMCSAAYVQKGYMVSDLIDIWN